MLPVSKMTVLRIFEPFLGVLMSNNADNFENPEQRPRSIAKVTIVWSLLVCYIMTIAMDLWYCYAFEFDLRIIAFPIAIVINSVQLVLTYASLWRNNERMRQTINTLSEMVDKRMFS